MAPPPFAAAKATGPVLIIILLPVVCTSGGCLTVDSGIDVDDGP